MKRVTVIGSPGTGKTIFAKLLAQKTGLPLIHLDLLYHDKSNNYYDNEDAWKAKVSELLQQESWIVDGNYNSTIVERVKRADTIFYFDFPRRKAFSGVVKRRITYRNKKRDDMPDDWKESVGCVFLKYVWKFNSEKKPKILNAISSSNNKTVIVFKNRSQSKLNIENLR